MVEMEPVLLPQSTSPKTQIWVSQAQPCQEQPALFGSLRDLVKMLKPKPAWELPPRSVAAASPRLRPYSWRTPLGSPTDPPPIPGESWAIVVCGLHRGGTSSESVLSSARTACAGLLFAVLFSVSEGRQMKHSSFLLFWARSCEKLKKIHVCWLGEQE